MHTVLELLNKSFSLNKDRTAVRIYDDFWSYGELDTISNKIATFLMKNGIKHGDRIIVLMNKSIYLYAAIIGIMKSGGVYIPVYTKTPPLRLSEILNDISPFYVFIDRLSITQYQKSQKFLQRQINTLFLEDTEWANHEKSKLEGCYSQVTSKFLSISPMDLAYIIFTSGSTGIPKGAMISHGNFYHNINCHLTHFDFGPGDVMSGLNAIPFDLSLADTFLSLCSGATLAVYPEEIIFPKDVLELTYKYGITRTIMVSSFLNSLVKSRLIKPERMSTLKTLIFAGEPLGINILIEMMEMFPHTDFYNRYGPTETTMDSAVNKIERVPHPEDVNLPIGFPLPEHIFILDSTDFQREENKGELIIIGPQVGAGYFNNPEKTKLVFGVNEQGERFYRTGDIASFDPEKGYFIHGRKDNQIKYKGYRVELEAIEHAVSSIPFVKEGIVIPIYRENEVEGLKLIYAADKSCKKEILIYLRGNLPSYMIPKYFFHLDQLPKNTSNKIDRKLIKTSYGKNTEDN